MSEDPLNKLYSQVTPKKLEFHSNMESNFKVFQPYDNEKETSSKTKPNIILKTTNKMPKTNVTNNPFPINTISNEKNDELQGNFDLTKDYTKPQKNTANENDYLEEKPILEELGIEPEHIIKKIKSVLTFHKVDKKILDDSDMTGPFLILVVFGACLLLQGKVQFGYLYGYSIFGCLTIFLLMNLMSKSESILLYNTISVMGYCMIPIVILSFMNVFLPLNSLFGAVFCIIAILFSSYSATTFYEEILRMNEQKWLIFYPVTLFYTCFVFLAIF